MLNGVLPGDFEAFNVKQLLSTLACLISASSAVADNVNPPLPTQFVCSIAAGYALAANGTMESPEQRVSGGVVTVDTQRGAVAGDTISAGVFSWSVLPPVDKRTAVKLLGTSTSGTAIVTVLTHRPQWHGTDAWYPFIFFDAGAGRVYSGTCRGVR